MAFGERKAGSLVVIPGISLKMRHSSLKLVAIVRFHHLAFLFAFLVSGCAAPSSFPASPSLTTGQASHSSVFTTSLISTPTGTISSPTLFPTFQPSTQQPSTFQPSSSPTGTPSFELCSPIEGFPYQDLPRIVSVGYNTPPKGQDDRHEGVDFCFYHWKNLGGIEGKGVQAVLPGSIAAALDGTFPYGSFVMVETTADRIPEDLRTVLKLSLDQSLYTLYAHLQDRSLEVYLGQEVTSCQVLGSVGRTGNTNAPHLHFETRIGPQGAWFEGMSNFVDSATEEERKNYRLWRIGGLYNHFDPMDLLLYGFEAVRP
jgi:murein DD-endopeptidase MepM/ murein hydrolase activator NlpD